MKNDIVLEHFAYLEKRIFKGFALHLSQPPKSTDFDTFLTTHLKMHKGPKFTLKNNDILIFFNNNKAPLMMDLMFLLKTTFPTVRQTRFDLKKDWQSAYQTVYDIQIFPTHQKRLRILNKLPQTPLTPSVLEDLLNRFTPAFLNTVLPIQQHRVILNLNELRQKHFPQIDLNTSPALCELFYRILTHRLTPNPDLFVPCCVSDLSEIRGEKISLRLSDVLRHLKCYQTFRKQHPKTPVLIERDITHSALNIDILQDNFVTFR